MRALGWLSGIPCRTLNEQLRLQRRRIPNAGRNKMMQLIIITRRKPLRHRLNALAIATCHI